MPHSRMEPTRPEESKMVYPRLPTPLVLLLALLCVSVPSPLRAQDEQRVVAVVDAYHGALATGDSATALSLLAEDVTILESGGVETKAQYRSGHLAGDMRFAQAVPRERSEIIVQVRGDVAWAWSTSVTEGRMGEREINSQGAELMVLTREGGEWKISAIHWSSRQRR
jgi:ketosteroid isomerase-like protein